MRLSGLVLLVFATFAMVSTGVQAQVRWAPPGENDLQGFLTWNGGAGGIAWNADAPSQDPGGPPYDAADNTKRDLEHKLITRVTPEANPLVPPLPTDQFVSAPLPKTIHLNPLYNIAVELFIDGGYKAYANYYDPCYYGYGTPVALGYEYTAYSYAGINYYSPDPWLGVELYADGKLVGGDSQGRSVSWYYADPVSKARPADPAGYAACRYLFHPEVETLPQGTVLTLKIIHTSQSKGFQYGMAGDHRSTLRLTAFSEMEWAYRGESGVPAAASSSSSSGDKSYSDAGAASTAGLGAGAMLLGAVAATRRDSRRLVLLAAMGALMFSGCIGAAGGADLGADGDPKGGSIQNTLVPVGDKNLTASGNGSIYGVVHDALNVPLAGVHVSLLSTNLFAGSDKKGLFNFPSLPAGSYSLRLDLKEYKSFEAQVQVKAGFATRLDITMEPLVERSGDAAWHKHDYWGDSESKVAADKLLGQTCSSGACTPISSFRLPAPEEGKGASSVLPGTRDVEVVISWDKAVLPVDRVGLMVMHNGDKTVVGGIPYSMNYSFFAPRASGQPFHIMTTWEMTDPGHQYYSSWAFYLVPAYQPRSTTANTDPYTKQGQYHAKVTLHRGVVPLEPAHPDRWEGRDAVEIQKYVATVYHAGPTGVSTEAYCMAYYPILYPQYKCAYNVAYFGAPKSVIPVEARWIEVTVNQSAPTTPHYDYDLRYRTGKNPTSSNYETWVKATNPIRDGWKSTKWRIPIGEGDADPIYNRASTWSFVGVPANMDDAKIDYYTGANFQLTFRAVAHKSAME